MGDGSLGDGGAVVIDAADGSEYEDRDGLIPFGGDATGGHNDLVINHPEGAQGSNGNKEILNDVCPIGCANRASVRHGIHVTYRSSAYLYRVVHLLR